MAQITAKNHYVPQHYLRAWSTDDVHVPAYRLLVPNERETLWRPVPIRRLCMEEHLYTSVLGGRDSDEFESWMRAHVEDPAVEPLDKVRSGRRMTPGDYHRLAYYFAALDLRTPTSYGAHARFVDRTMPGILTSVLQRLPGTLERGEQLAPSTQRVVAPLVLESESPPTRFRQEPDPQTGMVHLHVEVTNGREMWLRQIRRLLRTTARVLTKHRWVILNPANGLEWPTSDHPAQRLNYNSDTHYNFDGGWGSKGTDLLLPLSPEHLLYTRIGYRDVRHGLATPTITARIRRALVNRAHRWVLARTPSPDIPELRPRRVDRAQWMAERQSWADWHRIQSSAEQGGTGSLS